MVKPPRVRRRAGLKRTHFLRRRKRTPPNPFPELFGFVGLLTVIVSMLAFRRAERGRRAEALSPNRQPRASG